MVVCAAGTEPTWYVLLLAEHRASKVSEVGVTLEREVIEKMVSLGVEPKERAQFVARAWGSPCWPVQRERARELTRDWSNSS